MIRPHLGMEVPGDISSGSSGLAEMRQPLAQQPTAFTFRDEPSPMPLTPPFRATRPGRSLSRGIPRGIGSSVLVVVLLCGGGCSTLASLGLPLGVGPHRMLQSTQQMRNAASRPAPWPRELAKDVLPQYLIEPGDLLLVEATDFDSPVRLPSGDHVVQPDGTIDLGRYGRVLVSGKSIDEVQDEVRAEIKRKSEEPTGPISVRLVGWESKVVYVLGEVSSPGAYPFTGRETALDAILKAGDLTSRANRHKIILSRPTGPHDCRLVLPVCYDHIVQLGDTSSNYQLLPGDRVFVASMTILDDVLQSLLPHSFENCPRCQLAQRACPPQEF